MSNERYPPWAELDKHRTVSVCLAPERRGKGSKTEQNESVVLPGSGTARNRRRLTKDASGLDSSRRLELRLRGDLVFDINYSQNRTVSEKRHRRSETVASGGSEEATGRGRKFAGRSSRKEEPERFPLQNPPLLFSFRGTSFLSFERRPSASSPIRPRGPLCFPFVSSVLVVSAFCYLCECLCLLL